MDNLEKNLSQLPKMTLGKKADLRIKARIYRAMFFASGESFVHNFLHPHSLLAKISYVSLLIFVLLGGTAVYAANNDHITPGHSLYPVKKTIENVEQQLSLTKKSKVETLNKLSERRLKEAVNLSAENLQSAENQVEQQKIISDNIQQTITEAVDNINQAIDTSQTIENKKKAKEVKEQIKKKNEDIGEYLNNIDSMAKERQDEAVVKKVQEAKKTLEEYKKKLEEENRERIKSNRERRDFSNFGNNKKHNENDDDLDDEDGDFQRNDR